MTIETEPDKAAVEAARLIGKHLDSGAPIWLEDVAAIISSQYQPLQNSLDDLIHNARLLKRCPEFDGCDICKAEIALEKIRP